ncbi:hypothetical protein [Pseudomonas entomophila]|uniref:Uncharacterized protein n=2 Tax=Pseudomonas entomophila TaxID=312306 RepID=Q1IB35_PSEE4|nr:hypothetical protein [Pseudomonas entomophila]WMW04092.1 hypothetical protein RAH46_17345 [Pseudomonas entomophila]CAK15131.1 conserved hypothetical protein [Pseudomonas entomophila L48]
MMKASRARGLNLACHEFCHAYELLNAANRIGVKAHLADDEMAAKYISVVLDRYKPWKTVGHLSIGEGASKLPTDEHEFSFFLSVKPGAGWMFFEQDAFNKHVVVVIDDVRDISRLMEACYGMEYFVADENGTFLVAVNWYVIEFTDGAVVTETGCG